MSLQDNEEYLAIAEAIKGLVSEFRFVEHFIISPTDAEESELPFQLDDLTGEQFLDVEGYRVYVHEDCPNGRLGACVPESKVGLA